MPVLKNSQYILSVKSLKINFSKQPSFFVLNNIKFNLKKGETTALVGASGSGKSLMSAAIMGLLPKAANISGSIILNQQTELVNLNQTEYCGIRGKDISMIFQEPMTALNPVQACGSQIVESILIHQNISKKQAKILALDWMEKVKLPNPDKLFYHYPHQLSGGQKQRVMIAMAMCNHPKLLIADEPTTALDVTVQAEIIKLMKDLQKQYQLSLLFITHDLLLAKQIADEFLIIENGKINQTQQIKFPQTDNIKYKEFKNRQILLKVEDLVVRYPKEEGILNRKSDYFEAVKKVNFVIHRGEILGLVGESGCGKSTVGKTIMGLQKAYSGSIIYKGINILNATNKGWRTIRKNIQIIFQDPYASLNPRIKIGDSIKEVMKVHKIVKNEVLDVEMEKLLAKVQLPKTAANKYPHEFSGGQRQRICIARALALKPELIICDESVSALDIQTQEKIIDLLISLQKEEGLTYLFISHDLNVVKSISNSVMVMQSGAIVEQGSTEQVMQFSKNKYTKKLLAAVPS